MTFINTILVMEEPEKRNAKAFPSIIQQIYSRLKFGTQSISIVSIYLGNDSHSLYNRD